MTENVFGTGFDRNSSNLSHEDKFEAPVIDPTNFTYTNDIFAGKQENESLDKGSIENLNATTTATNEEEPKTNYKDMRSAPISDVYDSKNQLSTLIKNAKKNEKALEARNAKIKDAKERTKGLYGW